jgi:hypothetical protein
MKHRRDLPRVRSTGVRSACTAALFALSSSLVLTGCKKESKELAPEASALAAPAPAAPSAATFVVDSPSSKVSFQMDAELEKIAGRAPGSAQGEIFVDPKDLTKTTGLIKIDLLALSIYQTKRESAEAEFGAEEKNEKQNGHMQTWFQISPDAPADVREQNRFAEFKLKKVQTVSATDLTTLPGPERRVTAEVLGDFRLHGRVSEQKVSVEATFQFSGDKPTGMVLKTTQPFGVSLDAHDVRPRKAFDQLADATLETLGKKVNKVPQISFEITAKPK